MKWKRSTEQHDIQLSCLEKQVIPTFNSDVSPSHLTQSELSDSLRAFSGRLNSPLARSPRVLVDSWGTATESPSQIWEKGPLGPFLPLLHLLNRVRYDQLPMMLPHSLVTFYSLALFILLLSNASYSLLVISVKNSPIRETMASDNSHAMLCIKCWFRSPQKQFAFRIR